MISVAEFEFARAMTDSENLVAIHKELNTGAGRRTKEVSLNRAIVVLTVAAWQAFVQDLVREIVEFVEVPFGAEGFERYRLIKMDALKSVYHFSTPNAENTRRLLMNVGFDPWPHWRWSAGPTSLTELQVRERMDQWLRVRHAIAHGHEHLPDVPVLTRLAGGGLSLQRHNAESCMSFFERAVHATTIAVEAEFE